MQLEHTFTVPVPIDDAFKVLRDIERVAPCMPGATLDEVQGDEFTGTVKVKVGPMTVQYKGTARFIDVDEEQHSAGIEAHGKEARGSGTAKATIHAYLKELRADETEVRVHTDLAITGKPAQFGRGVISDIGEKLLGRFADCLASELGRQPEPAPAPGPDTPASAAREPSAAASATQATGAEPASMSTAQPAEGISAAAAARSATAAAPQRPAAAEQPAVYARPSDDAIDLLDVAGAPVLKRLAPVAAAVFLVLFILWIINRGK